MLLPNESRIAFNGPGTRGGGLDGQIQAATGSWVDCPPTRAPTGVGWWVDFCVQLIFWASGALWGAQNAHLSAPQGQNPAICECTMQPTGMFEWIDGAALGLDLQGWWTKLVSQLCPLVCWQPVGFANWGVHGFQKLNAMRWVWGQHEGGVHGTGGHNPHGCVWGLGHAQIRQ